MVSDWDIDQVRLERDSFSRTFQLGDVTSGSAILHEMMKEFDGARLGYSGIQHD